jgi:bifunctional DNase/RNase
MLPQKMKRKELKILGLSYHQTQVGSYICVVSERRGDRKIPIIIKTNEAQKIAMELEGISSNRPSSYDLIKTICDSFGMDCQEVFIYNVLEGVFYTQIIISNGIESITVDATIGDAIALSCVFKCPIYCDVQILNQYGVILNDDGTQSHATPRVELEDEDEFDQFIEGDGEDDKRVASVEELQILIDNAIENEEYEIAAELRDRIQMMKNHSKEVKKKKKK